MAGAGPGSSGFRRGQNGTNRGPRPAPVRLRGVTQNPWGRQGGQQQWGQPQWGAPAGGQNPWAQQAPWGQAGRQSGWGVPQQQWPPRGQVLPGMGGRPPRRPRNPLVTLLKVLLVLGALGFGGLMLLGAVLSSVLSGISAPEPTSYSTVDEPNSPWDPSANPATASPTPAASATTAPTTGGQVPDQGSYQNEDYQVPPPDLSPPPLPQPETYEEATQLLRANPLYSTSVPRPVRCDMAELNLQTASRQQLTDHFNAMTGCLMRVWEEPLSQAGFQAVRPTVTVYTGSVTSKCGKLPSRNAVYCGADQQVYYAQDLPRTIPASLRSSRYISEAVVAHEFGHAVQARSAILISEAAWEEQSNERTANDLSRRLETQADCLAGQFLGSIQQSTQMTDSELGNVGKLFYSIGDDVLTGQPGYDGNHGSGVSRQAWTQKGLDSTSVGSCNTFSAPANQVR